MKRTIPGLLVPALLFVCATTSQAFEIGSIRLEVRESTHVVQADESIADLLLEFASGNLICSRSIQVVDGIGSAQSCNGPNTDIATLITLELSGVDSLVTFEFGPDWGNGGVIFLENTTSLGSGLDDYWWKRDWDNPDVFRFQVEFVGAQEFSLSLLGFEKCCAGPMSLRYTTGDIEDEDWQLAESSSVPLPSGMALAGIGLLALGWQFRSQRRRP